MGSRNGLMKRRFGVFVICMLLRAPVVSGEEATIPKAIAPLPSWTGFYAGVNAGSLWTDPVASVDWSRLAAPGNLAFPSAFASVPQSGFAWSKGPGFAGGGQVGYNWQVSNNIVVGIETDFQGIAGGRTNFAGSSFSSTGGPNAIGSVRARGGYLVTPNTLVYGTGGFSYSGGN